MSDDEFPPPEEFSDREDYESLSEGERANIRSQLSTESDDTDNSASLVDSDDEDGPPLTDNDDGVLGVNAAWDRYGQGSSKRVR